MSLLLYSCFALPLWAVFFALYFILRREKLFKQSLLAKCGGSFLAVGSALFALYSKEENPPAGLLIVFFILCTLADALLELNFLPGMGLFAIAHICLIVCLWQAFPPTLWNLAVWAAAMAAAVVVFRRELPRMGWVALPCCLYVGVLSLTLSISLTAPFSAGAAYWILAAGALSFFVSDMMVAKSEFASLGDRYQKPIMLLYWLALYLISAVLW